MSSHEQNVSEEVICQASRAGCNINVMTCAPNLNPSFCFNDNPQTTPRHEDKQTKQTRMASYVQPLASYMMVQFNTRIADQETREQFYKKVVILSRRQPFIAVSSHSFVLPHNRVDNCLVGKVVCGDPVDIWDNPRAWATRLRLWRGGVGSGILCILDWTRMYTSPPLPCGVDGEADL